MRIPPMPPRDDRPAGDRCEVTLRDTFAAAALTGLLAARKFKAFDDAIIAEPYAEAAYCIADAMLRERSRTGQKMAEIDSSRAACPERDNTSAQTNTDRGSVTPESYPKNDEKRGDPTTKREPTEPRNGAIGEPVAWAVVHANGFGGIVDCYTTKQWCEYHFSGPHFRYVPLYRHPQPTLTDAEREAVEVAAEAYSDDHGERFAATLRGLLERLK